MYYSEMTKKAMVICAEAHAGQVDKGGVPYVFHPYHLAEQMTDEDSICVALLHDVLENSDWTAADLKEAGFNAKVIAAVNILTRDPHVSYKEYIQQVETNPLAKKVKLADLRHNSDTSRFQHSDSIIESLIVRYAQAIQYLEAPTGHKPDY